jgi:hypothetical protein
VKVVITALAAVAVAGALAAPASTATSSGAKEQKTTVTYDLDLQGAQIQSSLWAVSYIRVTFADGSSIKEELHQQAWDVRRSYGKRISSITVKCGTATCTAPAVPLPTTCTQAA